MKAIYITFLLFGFNSVYTQTNSGFGKKATNALITVNTKTDTSDITIIFPKSTQREIPKKWASLNAIQKEWIKVEKDSKGYLIYDPCDGSTPTIKLESGYITINGQIEPGDKIDYDKFTRLKGNKSFILSAYEMVIKATIINAKEGLVLWDLGYNEKWLMTPIENKIKFRQIKNNCPDFKRPELRFESIDK